MASAMASLALPSSLSTASSRLAQPHSQQVQQSVLVVRNFASPESPCSRSASKDTPLQFTSRRQAALSLAGLSLAVLTGSGSRAEASDVPLFGLKRKLEDVENAVEQAVVAEVKELVREGEEEASAVSSAVSGAFEDGLSPAVQAGLVAGAELVAVVAASSVVSSLVSQPSK